ncbi:hypothetical protein FW778_04215 [Ginsengibacter hankyongi]|uniref:Organic solvent tolerance-like N-terminal domain-containing protein n=1 Tax=Ginsengibacter hankyongi TaxID=2607284 RepID=A0A5J5IMD1_9BACT|nr:hypothetical protein [Ginsengibacter hankyongi]KAA9041247.1 hypothetical protein FW778_04215 [Ginsengibacter hankyongi]
MRRFVPAFLFLAIIVPFKNTVAQNAATANLADSYSNAKKLFQDQIKEDAHLYTGKEFIEYPVTIKGHLFFETDQMQNSAIFYDGTLYENIPLLYDLVGQDVVINRYNSAEPIKLLNEKIKYFMFDGHRFENIFSYEGIDGNVTNTFYDVMFNGKASVLVKRIKRIKNGIKAEDPASFVEQDELYVRTGNSLYAVDNKNAAITAFNNKKDLVKSFIRKKKFRFKKNIESELVATAEYYSTLNK